MTPLFALLTFGDFAILAWIGLICAGAAGYANRQPADLRRVERKLDALLKHQGVPALPAMSDEVKRLARDPATKIAAVKLHREETGLGLAEAKADVETFIQSRQ
jgi:hypothetical protein